MEINLTTIEIVVAIILGVGNFIFLAASLGLQEKVYLRDEKLEQLKEYGRQTHVITYTYIDTILLGPRNSGKTSIVESWTKPWIELGEITPSTTWSDYEIDVFEYDSYEEFDSLFDVKRLYKPRLRVKIRDNPGETHFRLQAVRDLEDMNDKVVLLLVFRVSYTNSEFYDLDKNAEYYSRAFIEEINTYIKNTRSSIHKVIVVFNMADKLPKEWNEDQALNQLREVNGQALHYIHTVFDGMLEYALTSAYTNYGLIKLMGNIAEVAVTSEEEKQKLQMILSRKHSELLPNRD